MKYRLLVIVAIFLIASSVSAAPNIPTVPPCGSTILDYFPISRIESITGQSVKKTGAFKQFDYGAKQFDVCSYVFEGQNNFIISSFWEMDSSAKAEALYTQLVETHQGDQDGVKTPAQKTPLDIGDKSTLALLKDFHPEGNLKYDVNSIFTLTDNVVFFLSSDTSVISKAGLEELMRGAVGQKSPRPTNISPPSISQGVYPASKNQNSNWISDNWKFLVGIGGSAVIALGLLAWHLRIKRKTLENTLPSQENIPPPPESPPVPPQI